MRALSWRSRSHTVALVVSLATSTWAPPATGAATPHGVASPGAPAHDTRGASPAASELAAPAIASPGQRPLRMRWGWWGANIGISVAFGLTGWLAKSWLLPSTCAWCEPSALERRTRARLRWGDAHAAARTSDVIAFGAIPALALGWTLGASGQAGAIRSVYEDLAVVTEAVLVTAVLSGAMKYAIARQRPYAWAHGGAGSSADITEPYMSFPSGHTSLAFAMVASAGTVGAMRGRRSAPVVWAVGLPLATGVAYLRVAGDRHWLGDVVAGAGLGLAVGTLLPLVVHGDWRHSVGQALGTGTRARRAGRGRRGARASSHSDAAQWTVSPTLRGVAVLGRF